MPSGQSVPAPYLTGPANPQEARHVASALRFVVLLAAVTLGLSSSPLHPVPFWCVTCAYAVSILVHMGIRRRRSLERNPGWVIFLFDVLAISLIIILRGRETQGLIVASFTLMLMAAIVEGLGNMIVNALLVACAYLVLTKWGAPKEQLLSFANLSQLALFFVIAVLMGHAADQGRQLAAARRTAERHRRTAQLALFAKSKDLRASVKQLTQARDSLRANERLYTMGMLAAGVSHEMRNPLSAIVAGAEAAESIAAEIRDAGESTNGTPKLTSELITATSECRYASDHLFRLVQDLNNLSRAGEVRTGEVDLADSLEGAARLLNKSTGGKAQIRVDARATRPAQADPGRVMQVIVNLGRNAIDAIGTTGGEVLLASQDVDEQHVALLIQDTGPGIPAEVQRRMYDPFVTTKGPGEGTGLGLHVVREIVKSHSGAIECESESGRGTQFRVLLPVAEAPVRETSQ